MSVAGSGAAVPAGSMLQRRDRRSLQHGQARLLHQPQCCRARLRTPKTGIKAISELMGEEPIYGMCTASVPPWGSDRAAPVLGSGSVKAGCITFHLHRSNTQVLGTNCTQAYPAEPVCPRTRLKEKQPASKRTALQKAKGMPGKLHAPLWVPFSGESQGSRNSAFAGCSVHWWGSRDWTLPCLGACCFQSVSG